MDNKDVKLLIKQFKKALNTLDKQRFGKIKVVERGLGREKAYGQAWAGQNLIEIDKNIMGKLRFSTLLHELLHVIFPEATEREVLLAERKMTKVLWEQGYRRVELK